MRSMPLALCLAVGSMAQAADIPVIDRPTRIPVGETCSFEFGTVPQLNTTVLLDITSRLDSDGFGGSMYFLKVVLNGRLVTAAKSRSVTRLRNRPLVSPVARGLPYAWFGDESWRVLYAPDFEGALKFDYYEGNPYRLLLDVTDLTNPAAENRLEITNTASRRAASYGKRKAELVLAQLLVRTEPGASGTMASAGGMDEDVINCGEPGAGPASYKGEVLAGGGFALELGGNRLCFGTTISYPNAGLNRLLPAPAPDRSGQPEWQVAVKRSTGGGNVSAAGPDYRLERSIRFTPRKVTVSDRVTNLHSDRKLGLLVSNELKLKGIGNRIRLAGNPDPAINSYYANGNPSVYVGLDNTGVGLLCEDDVFRNQARLFYDAETTSAGLKTEMLCLQPGSAYTLVWSVYPVASSDYFDFVNLVRQDWGSNYTVEGAWCFFNPDTIINAPLDFIRENFRRLGIRYACYCGGWVDRKHDNKKIGFGTGVMDPYWGDFRARLRSAAERIRTAVPECKVLVYYDTQRDTSDGGHERFKDSWLTNATGDQLSTEWSGVYSLTWSVVATVRNRFGKAMLDVVDRYFDDIGVDGLYWDEMEAVGYGAPLITYNTPDGYSCFLDRETYTVKQEVGITTLLGATHRLAVVDRVRARGGTLMGNGPTTVRGLLRQQVQRMVEIQHNDTWCYQGNLDTPLGYASSREDFGNWVRALDKATLLVGTRYTYKFDFSRYAFPFTPIELHPGYLLGEERILATHSGNYGWPGERCLVRVHHFDRDGQRTDRAFATTVTTEARTKADIADNEAVVLERLPVTVEPVAGAVEATLTDYGQAGLSLSLRAPLGAKLMIATGRMHIGARDRLEVAIGDAPTRQLAAQEGVLTLSVPALPNSQELRVKPSSVAADGAQ